MSAPNDIVLFHYPFSPYARRIVWYLTLRGIPYAQCLIPPMLPREDVNALGVKYRRIPILSIGRDIYCDTRLILRKLETLFPPSSKHRALSSSSPSDRALSSLLEKWTIDGGVFMRCAQLIPPELPLIKDPRFKKDREDYTGRSWQEDDIKKQRPEAIAAMRECFAFLEDGILGDDREWVGGGKGPGIADLQAVWPFHWLLNLPGALPPELFSAYIYPKIYAWIERFTSAVSSSSAPKPVTLKGAEAIKQVTSAEFASVEKEMRAEEDDPLQLKAGQDVEVWPTDTGFRHRDRGRLVGLMRNEVVVEVQSKVGGKTVRVHMPREGFRVQAVSGDGGSKL